MASFNCIAAPSLTLMARKDFNLFCKNLTNLVIWKLFPTSIKTSVKIQVKDKFNLSKSSKFLSLVELFHQYFVEHHFPYF